MKSLNILAVTPDFYKSTPLADKRSLRLIRAVSPIIKVKDGAALTEAERHGDYSRKQELDALLAWADVIFGLVAPPNTIARAPNLKWIQVISAGVDRWVNTDVWNSRVVITGTSGIHSTPISEFVLSLMLMFAKNAPHREDGVKLMEFLASDEGQEMYADVNNEYPVKECVPWSPLVQSWGSFKSDPISLNEVAALRKKASELVDKVGFDDGPSS